MEGGRTAIDAGDEGEREDAWRKASLHAKCQGQPCVNVHESRTMERGGAARGAGTRGKREVARRRAPLYADYQGQPRATEAANSLFIP